MNRFGTASQSRRAVEQRRYLVRASTSGPSAVVDPWGRVQARTSMGESAVLHGSVRPRRELSLYAKIGDSFALCCAIAAVAALPFVTEVELVIVPAS